MGSRSAQKPTQKPQQAGPPRGGDKLSLRDALAFILAAFLHLLPYIAIVVGLIVLFLLIARLLG